MKKIKMGFLTLEKGYHLMTVKKSRNNSHNYT
jgi:hypothetical protein